MESNWFAIFAVEMIVLAMMWRVFEKRSNKPVDRFFREEHGIIRGTLDKFTSLLKVLRESFYSLLDAERKSLHHFFRGPYFPLVSQRHRINAIR
jgi:hypothetical protein